MRLSELTQEEVGFVEEFEQKQFEYSLLKALEDSLTIKGWGEYMNLRKWIDENTDRFLTLTG